MSLLRRPPEHDPDPDLDLLGAPASAPLVPVDSGFRGPIEAMLRHPLLALAPVVLCVAVAVVAGLVRSPTYVSQARISVGRADVPAYTLQGSTIGNATLAASYARAVPALAVTQAAARAGKVSLSEARRQIFGSPVPGSTLIRIDAAGDSSVQARRMANAAARALITYVIDLNGRQRPKGLMSAYRAAQRRTDRARLTLRRTLLRHPPRSTEAERARLDLLTAQLRSQSLSTRVVQTRVAPSVPNQLQLIQPATFATSDKGSMLSRMALIALAVGVVLGIGLALLRANADLLRTQRERLRRRS